MTTPTFPTSPSPAFDTAPTTRTKTLTAQFGDGYSQRAADGINNVLTDWDVVWKVITAAERATLVEFLEARAGFEAFYWTSPLGVQKKYICSEWSFPQVEYNVFNGSAKFKQVLDL